MKNDVINYPNRFIYPGIFVPMQREANELHNTSIPIYGDETGAEQVKVTELENLFKVEIAIPDTKREDFLLYADENILTICIVPKEQRSDKTKFQIPDHNYECFNRTIVLPDNADAEFSCAEYKAGILHLYVHKSKQPLKNLHAQIVVY